MQNPGERKRKRIAILLIMSIVAGCVLAIPIMNLEIQEHRRMQEEEIQRLVDENPGTTEEYWRDLVDFTPFYRTPDGIWFTATILSPMILVWIVCAWFVKGNKKLLRLTIALAIVCLSSLTVPIVLGSGTPQINVLVIYDRQMDSLNRYFQSFLSDSKREIAWIHSYFLDGWNGYAGFGISLNFKFYCYWDSGSSTNMPDLLDRGISQVSWKPEGRYIDGVKYHILMVLTGKQDVDMIGYSPPFLRAMIVQYYRSGTCIFPQACHEIAHQFGLGHCGDWFCLMNTDSPLSVRNCFCGGCASTLIANKWSIVPDDPPEPPRYYNYGGGGWDRYVNCE